MSIINDIGLGKSGERPEQRRGRRHECILVLQERTQGGSRYRVSYVIWVDILY